MDIEFNFSIRCDFTVNATRMFKTRKPSFPGICWVCFGDLSF